jgi:Phage tail protein (Tail_P2_I)
MTNLPWDHDIIDLQDEVPLDTFAHDLYEDLAPLTIYDQENDWALAHYVGAIGTMIQDVADLSREPSSWSYLVSPDLCPPEALGWLAQFVGIRLPQKITEGEARAIIKDEQNFRRGTEQGIREAIQKLLVDTKYVGIIERADSNAYKIVVNTWFAETPDQDAVEALLADDGPNAILPAGIIYDYVVTAGQMTFGHLRESEQTFAEVETNYDDFEDLWSSPPPP